MIIIRTDTKIHEFSTVSSARRFIMLNANRPIPARILWITDEDGQEFLYEDLLWDEVRDED